MKSKKIKSETIFSLLLILVVCMNVVRFILNITESSFIVYLLYMLLIGLGFLRRLGTGYKEKIGKLEMTVLFFIVTLGFYALLDSFFQGSGAVMDASKFMLLLLIALIVYGFSLSELHFAVQGIVYFNFIYAIILIMNPSRINEYQIAGGNYLTMTLPLGLALTICFSKIVTLLYLSIKNIKSIVLLSFVSSIIFWALTLFSARSSLIFPIVCTALLAIVQNKVNRKKAIIVIGIIVVFGIIGYNFFLTHASSYMLYRMQSLFSGTADEDRWDIWKLCWDTMKNNYWYILGGGTNAFVNNIGYYPHNIYLQLLGEHGIVGIFSGLLITLIVIIEILRKQRIVLNNINIEDEHKVFFFQVISGILYLWLTYMKSFSLYESGPLLMFAAIALKTCKDKSCTKNKGE